MPSTLMLLTNPFRPDPRVLREARSLTKHGIDVHLVAWDREGGRKESAQEHGISVLRLGPRCQYRSVGKVLARLPRFWFRALRSTKGMQFDAVHCHDFDTLLIGLIIGGLRGKPVLFDAHEIYSAMISKDVGGFSTMVHWIELTKARYANEVITVNPALVATFSKGRRNPARLVMNSPDTASLRGPDVNAIRQKHGLKGFVISYLGSLEPGRFVDEMINSVEPGGGVTLAIAGEGTMRAIVSKAAQRNESIMDLGTLDSDEALRVTFASDLVIVMLDPSNPNYKMSTPVKLLDAMACGKPVVISEGLDAAELVRKVECGFIIPYDKDNFKSALAEARMNSGKLKDMGARGRAYFESNLSSAAAEKELIAAYSELLGVPLH